MSFELAVIIGRFQPFHVGHFALLQEALNQAPKVLVVLGSAGRARTIRDPWSPNERREMIRACFPGAVQRILFAPIEDRLYNDQQWVSDVQEAVAGVATDKGESANGENSVVLVGYAKDNSSYYLKLFPQWSLHEIGLIEGLSATELRDLYFGEDSNGAAMQLRASLPEPVSAYLETFRKGDKFKVLAREWQFIHAYRNQFKDLQYPPTFVTADAVVIQSGHVLLVRRGSEPGRGLWALPGGFVDVTERVEAAMLRELYEETRIKCPEPVLIGAVRESKVFDHPDRSLRGRTITHAYLMELAPYGSGLYSVKGGSDASKARWFPISTVLAMGESMFDDHLDIVRYFLGHI